MGLSFRRSVRVGPFRVNFSGSGIGLSTGVPGFRIGTGPRGAYVHMGAGGIYYRQSLSGGNTPSAGTRKPFPVQDSPSAPVDPTLGRRVEIDSGSVLAMEDSSSAALLAEIRSRRSRNRLAPWAALLTVVGTGVVAQSAPAGLAIGVATAGLAITLWLAARDAVARTVVLFYDMDAPAQQRFEALATAIMNLCRVGAVRHVAAETDVRDGKYHAGASQLVEGKPVAPKLGSPPGLKLNVDVPLLPVGRQTIAFLPDRLLVFDGVNVGAVGYPDLSVTLGSTQWIESGSPPTDGEIVGRTWRYVNKRGGPDRRFKDNRELAVVRYETLHFTSTSGVNELLHASRIGIGGPISTAVGGMAHLPQEPIGKPRSAVPSSEQGGTNT